MGGRTYITGYSIIIKHNHKDHDKKMERTIISSRGFNAYYGSNHAVKNVNLDVPKNQIVAVMGPSGCGKTTYLRCINRMHELTPGATAKGSLKLYDDEVYGMNPIYVRY